MSETSNILIMLVIMFPIAAVFVQSKLVSQLNRLHDPVKPVVKTEPTTLSGMLFTSIICACMGIVLVLTLPFLLMVSSISFVIAFVENLSGTTDSATM